MPSSTTTVYHQQAIYQISTDPLTRALRSKSSKKALLYRPMAPSPTDDWVLFPKQIVKHNHSSDRPGQSHKRVNAIVKDPQMLSSPASHVIRPQAAMSAKHDDTRGQAPKAYRFSTCLEHMSVRNCTTACGDVKSVPDLSTPPKAPSPPRLPTPDLSDFEDKDLWSCCNNSESNESNEVNESTHDDDFWGEMGISTPEIHYSQPKRLIIILPDEKLVKAMKWQSKTKKEARRSSRAVSQ